MELYPEDLQTMLDVMVHLENIASIYGVFEVEIRVRIQDTNTWTILGYGEAGDPCVLRFEETKKPDPLKPNVYTINSPQSLTPNVSPISPWAGNGLTTRSD